LEASMSVNPDGCPFVATCKEYFKWDVCPKEKEKEFCMVYYDMKEQIREQMIESLENNSD